MNPFLAVLMPIVLTTIFGLSYLAAYELLKENTIGKWLGAIAIAMVGALSLDIAISIIVGN